MELVEMMQTEVVCDSNVVAKKFGYKNANVVILIKKVINDIGDFRVGGADPKYQIEKREYRGRSYTAYLMNRDFFSFLVMRFKGKKAIQWQLKFIAAFNAMERQLILEKTNAADPKWVTHRKQLIVGRRSETDVIKDFVEYATSQGSKSAKFYYKHITNATYKALGMLTQRKPKLRDTMNIYEISELLLAERIARISLQKYMDMGRNYKDIYESVKNDLIDFSTNLRIAA